MPSRGIARVSAVIDDREDFGKPTSRPRVLLHPDARPQGTREAQRPDGRARRPASQGLSVRGGQQAGLRTDRCAASPAPCSRFGQRRCVTCRTTHGRRRCSRDLPAGLPLRRGRIRISRIESTPRLRSQSLRRHQPHRLDRVLQQRIAQFPRHRARIAQRFELLRADQRIRIAEPAPWVGDEGG